MHVYISIEFGRASRCASIGVCHVVCMGVPGDRGADAAAHGGQASHIC